jgi:2-methylcitrate dehydratase PrpD
MPYNIAVAAYRIRRGVEWLDPDTRQNPQILQFMDKIVSQADPDYMAKYMNVMEKDPLSALAKVQVVARGQTFTVEREHRKGTTGTEAAATEEELIEKFRHNAVRVLTEDKINRAVEALVNLENIGDISQLMRQVTI